MLRIFGLAWCVVCACTVSDGPSIDGNLPGHITANTTWTGTQQILTDTTIDPGVTVTVSAGTTLAIKAGTKLAVAGTLDVQGTSAGKVTIHPDGGASSWNGIQVANGGVVTLKYAIVTGGPIQTAGTAHITIVDSQMSHAVGDLLIMNGGNLDMSYSSIGVEPPATDTTHCDMHFGGTGNVIKVVHSNISTSSYGLMFYSGQVADFTFDSWFSNSTTNVDAMPGVSGDFSSGYFQGSTPSGVGITANTPANARLAACTGTNDASCSGPRP